MREHQGALEGLGARLAAVGLGDRTYARFFREETGISFPLLIDEKREAYKAAGLRSASLLHLIKKENGVARARAKRAGHRQHKLGQNPFQLGGSFVFSRGGDLVFAHLSKTFGDNADPKDLLAALR